MLFLYVHAIDSPRVHCWHLIWRASQPELELAADGAFKSYIVICNLCHNDSTACVAAVEHGKQSSLNIFQRFVGVRFAVSDCSIISLDIEAHLFLRLILGWRRLRWSRFRWSLLLSLRLLSSEGLALSNLEFLLELFLSCQTLAAATAATLIWAVRIAAAAAAPIVRWWLPLLLLLLDRPLWCLCFLLRDSLWLDLFLHIEFLLLFLRLWRFLHEDEIRIALDELKVNRELSLRG